jgi:uncharacterized protein YgbK (DUF1537 family)
MILAGVADDFSGANDLAGRLAGLGFKSYVSRNLEFKGLAGGAEALILNAQTRLLGPDEARIASRRAWLALNSRVASRVCFHKMDSTLRGWPGEDILGFLEASAAPRVAFCAAYPRHGRVIRGGVQYTQGLRLDRTEYFSDPLSPAKVSRPVDLFPKGLAVAVAAGGLKRALAGAGRVLCFDAEDEKDLRRIARDCLAAGIRHFAGASGLGHAVAERFSSGAKAPALPRLPRQRIALVGSVSGTAFTQLRALEASGKAAWLLADSRSVKVALSTLQDRSQLRKGRLGVQQTLAQRALKSLVKRGLSRVKDPAQAFWFLTGGHTAETFYKALGFKGNWVLGELLPGVPLCLASRATPRKPVLCATKPGGFGREDTLVRVMTLE